MPKFKAEIKKVTTGKSCGDPQATVTMLLNDFETIAYLGLFALQENSIIELEYKADKKTRIDGK